MTNEELERAVERLKKAPKIADQYATGVHFGEGNDGFVSFADLRALLTERAELRATVERMRGALVRIRDGSHEHSAAYSVARAALTTGEEK